MRISLAIAFLLSAFRAFSQTKDAGLWMDVSLARELTKRLELSVSPEIRLNQNLSQWSRVFADVGADYKLDKHWSLHAAYRGGWGNDGIYIDPRQRWQTGVSYKQKWKDFTLHWLTRSQYTVVGPLSDTDADFVTIWRNRFSIKYTGLKKTDVATSFEFFNSMHRYQSLQLQNWRWIAQVSRKISKRQSMVLGYLIQRDFTKSPNALDYVLLVSYKIDL